LYANRRLRNAVELLSARGPAEVGDERNCGAVPCAMLLPIEAPCSGGGWCVAAEFNGIVDGTVVRRVGDPSDPGVPPPSAPVAAARVRTKEAERSKDEDGKPNCNEWE